MQPCDDAAALEDSDEDALELKGEEERGEMMDTDIDSEKDGDDEAVVDRANRYVDPGLRFYDIAKTRRTVCMLCETEILKGSWRVLYRSRRSSAQRDEKFLHFSCANMLPLATRAGDFLCVSRWLSNPSITVAERTALTELKIRLEACGAEASGSAGSSGG